MARKRGERDRVHSGLQISLGPVRFMVNSVENEKANVHAIIFNEASFTGSCPVRTFERLMDWHSKLPISLI